MCKRRSNALVAWLALFALLMCQAAGLVHARTFDGPISQQGGAACHSVPGEDGQPVKTAHVPCDYAQTAGETFKLPGAAPALPASIAALSLAPARPTAAPRAVHFAVAGAPPPLHLLHCRLLN